MSLIGSFFLVINDFSHLVGQISIEQSDWSRFNAAVTSSARCHLIGQSALSPVPSTSFSSFKATPSDETTPPHSEAPPSRKDTPSCCRGVGFLPDLHTESLPLLIFHYLLVNDQDGENQNQQLLALASLCSDRLFQWRMLIKATLLMKLKLLMTLMNTGGSVIGRFCSFLISWRFSAVCSSLHTQLTNMCRKFLIYKTITNCCDGFSNNGQIVIFHHGEEKM